MAPALAADRSGRPRNRRDITGTRYARQQAEQAAKRAAANINVDDVRREAFAEGYRAAFDKAFTDGWDALAEHLVQEGVLAPDEPGEAK